MRKKATIIITTLTFLFIATLATAQLHSYEISRDTENGSKVLKGLLTRSDIQNDSAFKWFNDNMRFGQANVAAVDAFKKHTNDFQLVIFAGTWCEDTQNLLPAFYRLIDKSGFPESSITLIGVDRPKTTLYNLHNAFHATRTPTFIVMKDGREIGRVEEYGKSGQVDKELGEIVATIQ